ncbi:MAG: glycosyltransferase family 2 protein [Actinomycetota bacterium]|nr:glycosyltransferase family 2 protein [Actinomycetota bacterium]MDQ3350662.1 glycosyltransferase family 2 protein [Actinomycetota bacterium]
MSDHAWPDVDVVMPVRNEAGHLEGALAAIDEQEYPGTLRIVVAVGPSSDGTEEIADRLAAQRPDLTVVPSPTGTTPAGLNLAIGRGSAPIVVRVDGHSRLNPGYIAKAVETLIATGSVNVGGVQRAVGDGPMPRAIAAAMTSRFGTGGSRFHVGGRAGPVDTVYLGVFDRRAIEAAGLFDEGLHRNQDYELNVRLRAAGGVVWFDPSLSVEYRPRDSLAHLARQYFQYGQFKRRVLAMHPSSLRPRQAIPPFACGLVIAGAVMGARWRPALLVPAGYVAVLTAAALAEARRHEADPVRLAAALATIHFSWSAGLVRGHGTSRAVRNDRAVER